MIRPRRWGIFDRDSDTFSRLREFEYVPDYQRTLALEAEIFDLRELRQKTRNAPVPKSELLKVARKWFQEIQDQRIKILQDAISSAGIKGKNPFLNLTQHGNLSSFAVGTRNFFGFLSWPEVESAIGRLSDDEKALSQRDRGKALDHIDKRLRGLEAELEEIYPKNSRFRRAGAVGGDLRGELISIWLRIQKQCNAPCGPTGEALKYSNPKEQGVYELLKIGQFLNPDADFQPWEDI